jgi:DNA repair ATPase RecN
MLLSKKLNIVVGGLTLALIAALSLPASAESRMQDPETQRKVADRLDNFKSTAFQMQRHADTLQSHKNSNLSWQSHVKQLANLKDHVNQLGKSLAELEGMKPHASDTQRLAIDHARPHLVAIAENTARAIEMLNDNHSIVRFPEYGEVADDIYDHADELHTKLDAILDFEDSKGRLEALELQPMSSEGS